MSVALTTPVLLALSCVCSLCLHSSGLDMVGRLLYAQVASASSSASNNRRSSAPVLAMLPTLAPEPLSLSPFPELPYLFAVGQNRHYHDHCRHQQSADTFHAPRAGTEASSRPLNQNTVTSLVSQARMHSQPNMSTYNIKLIPSMRGSGIRSRGYVSREQDSI